MASPLSELARHGRLWDVSFEDLTSAEQVFRAVWELSGEVDNGGFDQYYSNSSGDAAFAVVEALERIGAPETASIVARANAVFPDGTPPRDRAARVRRLDALDAEDTARLAALSRRFQAEPDDLDALLLGFVLRHADEIQGAPAPE